MSYFQHIETPHPQNGGLNASAGGMYHLSGVRGFTPSQWLELEQQALIYKYMTANVPIPVHLMTPIIKAFESAGLNFFNGGWSPFSLGCSNSTDPEPGRCRRTDGKKWRCSNDALANHKYCEKHLKKRSRKHVEGRAKSIAASCSAPLGVQSDHSSSSFDINYQQHNRCQANSFVSRMQYDSDNSFQRSQDAPELAFLHQATSNPFPGLQYNALMGGPLGEALQRSTN